MPNDFFKYKQFIVYQDQCAMKVCTDSSLFGALIEPGEASTALDIGTGTGVLSLMVKQKAPNLPIDAVEIDAKASNQAQRNFRAAPWNGLDCYNEDIQDYQSPWPNGYQLIFSNPPFFKSNLKSGDKATNLARHDEGLTLNHLVAHVDRLLHENGTFWLLLPEYEFSLFEETAQERLTCYRKISVKNMANSKKLRVIGVFHRSGMGSSCTEEEIVVKNPDQSYTDQFASILKDYYLIF